MYSLRRPKSLRVFVILLDSVMSDRHAEAGASDNSCYRAAQRSPDCEEQYQSGNAGFFSLQKNNANFIAYLFRLPDRFCININVSSTKRSINLIGFAVKETTVFINEPGIINTA